MSLQSVSVQVVRLLICGDRDWTDLQAIKKELAKLLNVEPVEDIVLIEGEARGADKLSRQAAEELGIYRLMPFPADWDKFKKRAGPIRNQQMLDEGRPEEVWAFHDHYEDSKGTKDMVTRAEKAGLPVKKFKHPSRTGTAPRKEEAGIDI